MSELEKDLTVNYSFEESSPRCIKLTKKSSASFLTFRPKLGSPTRYKTVMETFRINLCSLHIGQVLRLSGAASPDVLHFPSLPITLTVPDVLGTEDQVTYNLPFILDPCRIANIQS